MRGYDAWLEGNSRTPGSPNYIPRCVECDAPLPEDAEDEREIRLLEEGRCPDGCAEPDWDSVREAREERAIQDREEREP